MPCSSIDSACSIRAPTRMTAVVVPSPTSLSCVRATSITIFAPGVFTAISPRIVAPSFVITISPPAWFTSILSMPRGPSVDLTALAIAFAAIIFERWTSFPRVRVVPSLRM